MRCTRHRRTIRRCRRPGAFLTRLTQTSGIATPTRADLEGLDRKRKKKGSNDDWTYPDDTDARITKMKDGRTHLRMKPTPRSTWTPGQLWA